MPFVSCKQFKNLEAIKKSMHSELPQALACGLNNIN